MLLCIFQYRPFEGTFKNTQWRKVKQMQPMLLCIFLFKQFEDAFENTQWRKDKQMPPMWLCILSGRSFEDAFENAQWRKVKQMHATNVTMHHLICIMDTFLSQSVSKILTVWRLKKVYFCRYVWKGEIHSFPMILVPRATFKAVLMAVDKT